jgi:hypothetical protein
LFLSLPFVFVTFIQESLGEILHLSGRNFRPHHVVLEPGSKKVHEELMIPTMDVCKSTIELVLFQNESSLVCNEENIHETQVVLEP